MPLTAFLGSGREPGEVAGHGPVDAATSRDLAAILARSAGTRWCLTLTGPGGRAAGHACAPPGPAAGAARHPVGRRPAPPPADPRDRQLPPPPPGRRLRPARHSPPPDRSPAAPLRPPRLPPPRRPLRPRPHRPLRPRRPHLRMQPRAAVQTSPPVQASRRLAPRAAKTGPDDLANTQRPRLPDHRRPLLTSATARPAIQRHRHQPGRPSPRIGLPGYRHAIGTCKHLSAGRAVRIRRHPQGAWITSRTPATNTSLTPDRDAGQPTQMDGARYDPSL